MSVSQKIKLLKQEIKKTIFLLEETDSFYGKVCHNELKLLGKSQSSALIIAQILENYYTCLETLFLKISQFFENSLDSDKWHNDLLDKMTLDIEGIRKRVITDRTHKLLIEIMRFRHFKRYYFELDYDWERLDYLMKRYDEVKLLTISDLNKFSGFLDDISENVQL